MKKLLLLGTVGVFGLLITSEMFAHTRSAMMTSWPTTMHMKKNEERLANTSCHTSGSMMTTNQPHSRMTRFMDTMMDN